MLDNVVVKLPTEEAQQDFLRFVVFETPMEGGIRKNEPLERRDNLDKAMVSFPELSSIVSLSRDDAHFAVIHKIQHGRLREANVAVPELRVCVIYHPTRYTEMTAFVQERITGISIAEMVDVETKQLKPTAVPYVPSIKVQLEALLASPIRSHINWYPRNFILQEGTSTLYYVDCKPSTLYAAQRTHRNIPLLAKYFHLRQTIGQRLFGW